MVSKKASEAHFLSCCIRAFRSQERHTFTSPLGWSFLLLLTDGAMAIGGRTSVVVDCRIFALIGEHCLRSVLDQGFYAKVLKGGSPADTAKSRVGQTHPVHSHDNEVKPKFRKFSIHFLVDFIFPFLLPADLLKTEEKHHLGWKYSSFLFSAQREGGSSFAICSHGCSMLQTSDHCGCSLSPFIRDS